MSWLADFIKEHSGACYIKSHFGFDCPGCGSQRAALSLLDGNVWESIQYQPGLLPFLFTILFTIAHLVFKFKNGPQLLVYFYVGTISVFVINYLLKLSGVISGHP